VSENGNSKVLNEKEHPNQIKDRDPGVSDCKKKNSVTSITTVDLNKKKFTVNQIIAEFILTISRYSTLDFGKELIVVMALFRKALNEKGRAFLEKRGEPQDQSIELCNECDIKVAPEISNYFISELFPGYFGQLNR
jgi:hypothetical protein